MGDSSYYGGKSFPDPSSKAFPQVPWVRTASHRHALSLCFPIFSHRDTNRGPTYRGTWVRLFVARQDSLRFQQLTLIQIFQGLKRSILCYISNPFRPYSEDSLGLGLWCSWGPPFLLKDPGGVTVATQDGWLLSAPPRWGPQ